MNVLGYFTVEILKNLNLWKNGFERYLKLCRNLHCAVENLLHWKTCNRNVWKQAKSIRRALVTPGEIWSFHFSNSIFQLNKKQQFVELSHVFYILNQKKKVRKEGMSKSRKSANKRTGVTSRMGILKIVQLAAPKYVGRCNSAMHVVQFQTFTNGISQIEQPRWLGNTAERWRKHLASKSNSVPLNAMQRIMATV